MTLAPCDDLAMSRHGPRPRATSSTRPRGVWAAALLGVGIAGFGCDAGSHGKDASASTSQRLAQVSVRLDFPSGSAAAVSMLAFRAEAIDVASGDVLGAVDPLVAPPPESACELRDVAGTARALRAQGGTVSLRELGGVMLAVDGDHGLRPALRVYPPRADVVAGVIGEAGPLDLSEVPRTFTLAVAGRTEPPSRLELVVPPVPSVLDNEGAPLDSHTSMSIKHDLVLRVSGPARTFLEIRPFGAPSAIACAVSTGGWVVVPHDLLAKLVATAGRAPVSFEAVWREDRFLVAGSDPTRVSFEARSSAVLDLRP
jgi:hypothetical protein